jgi:hypothetical protein
MFKARSKSGFDRCLSAERNLDMLETRIEHKERRTKARKKRRYYGLEYACHSPHLFQLFIAGKKFPRQKIMTIVERSKKNRDFEDKFVKTFDENGDTKRKLSAWKFVDYPKYKKGSEIYVTGRMTGKPHQWPRPKPDE